MKKNSKRNMNPNSIEVYFKSILPSLKGRKLEVLIALKELGGSATMYEVSEALRKPLHVLSGRYGELCKMGLIVDSGKKKIHRDSPFTIWSLK